MQKLAELCVRRPVFATMLVAAITVVGAISFTTLGVDRYPRIELPTVSVSTTNSGAAPENVETEISDRIEAAVNTVAGIDELRSSSTEGQSRVVITFDLSKDPDIAAQEVRAKVDPVIRRLPDTADPPGVQKQDPDSNPIMLFSVSAPMSATELTTYLEQSAEAPRDGRRCGRGAALRRPAARDSYLDRPGSSGRLWPLHKRCGRGTALAEPRAAERPPGSGIA
jgi:HAE1 family hydrophobic/amphiphilic exporter-1